MVQIVKNYTIGVSEKTYKKMYALALRHQHSPDEIVTIAINLLAVALNNSQTVRPNKFQLPARGSTPATKP